MTKKIAENSDHNIGPLPSDDCVANTGLKFQLSEFVVFYRNVASSSTTVLCASYSVNKFGDSGFSCKANFDVADCNATVVVTVEAWSVTGQLLQPTSRPLGPI
jgi:hypothetical protein